MKLQIRDTGAYGNGVYTEEPIERGRIIGVLDGITLTLDECIEKVRRGEENVSDPLQVSLEVWLDLDEPSRTFNHSCHPNAGIRKRSELFALRNISAGEEITYDYSLTVGPNVPTELWTMSCLCGHKECRKRIGNVVSIPERRLAEYQKLGALQDYMKDELQKLRKVNGTYILPEYRRIVL